MLRIVLGFKTASRSEVPSIVYLGDQGAAEQTAIDAAEEGIIRFEKLHGVSGFPGRRTVALAKSEPASHPTSSELAALAASAAEADKSEPAAKSKK